MCEPNPKSNFSTDALSDNNKKVQFADRLKVFADMPGYPYLAEFGKRCATLYVDDDTIVIPAIDYSPEELKKWAKRYVAKELWAELGDVPYDGETESLDATWYIQNSQGVCLYFPKGTCRYEIWHWFEDAFDVSVATDLMCLEDEPEGVLS